MIVRIWYSAQTADDGLPWAVQVDAEEPRTARGWRSQVPTTGGHHAGKYVLEAEPDRVEWDRDTVTLL